MIMQDQTKVQAFLTKSASVGYSGDVGPIKTHISEIFLADTRAFKLKRAVKLPYLDFSTPQLRLRTCHREVELNRRTASELYLGVRTITRGAGGELEFDGKGEIIDAVVEMVRFKSDHLFDLMAEKNQLSSSLIRQTVDMIARFHLSLESIKSTSGAETMENVLTINERGFAASHVFDPDEISELNHYFRSRFAVITRRLDTRGANGKIVLGHGDLHLRNICLFENQPTLFDCIEFNDSIATVDVLYDLAFLLMDLWHRNLFKFASLTANRYCDLVGDSDGFSLLPFFMATRAAVRAHVLAVQAEEGRKGRELSKGARSYFDLAWKLLQKGKPHLVIIGGLSGSGKSTIAEALAPALNSAPGARIIESDRIRKHLHGMLPEKRLPQSAYSREMNEQVYDCAAEQAGNLLSDGCVVVANAVYSDDARRCQIENVARDCGVPFTGIWLDAPPDILRSRIHDRRVTASDADVTVLELQMRSVSLPHNWHRVDAVNPVGEIVRSIVERIERCSSQDGSREK